MSNSFSIHLDSYLSPSVILALLNNYKMLVGYETSASALTFSLFEIARNPDIQRKIHEEIDRVLAEHDGKLTYDSINDLKYLECCIDGWSIYFSIYSNLN